MSKSAPADTSKIEGRSQTGKPRASGPFPVTFEVPGILANKGVHVAVFGRPMFGAHQNSFVYLTSSGSWVLAPYGQNLPLINLFPHASLSQHQHTGPGQVRPA